MQTTNKQMSASTTTSSGSSTRSLLVGTIVVGALYFLYHHVDERYVELQQSLASINQVISHQTQLLEKEPHASGNQEHVCPTSTAEETVPSPTLLGNPLAGFVEHTVNEYDKLLAERVISQVESWVFLPEYENVDESLMDACPRVTPKVRSVPEELSEEELEEFVWDDEDDIDGYMERLFYHCSLNAVEFEDFSVHCWDFMYDLVYRPRCTTRFDSTVVCTSDESPYELDDYYTPEEVIDNHFSQDTLNVVIIGAGPTGLFLANALTVMNRLPKSAWRPEIRVTVIESRVAAPGVKQGYIRNWQTVPHLESTAEPIDERLTRLFIRMTGKNFFALPLNLLETLLLLSCRDLGVKFLYGNLTDYTSHLSQQPNLVVFDSTGHRLNGLSRGNNCPAPEPVLGIESGVVEAEEIVAPWVPLDDEHQSWYYVDKDQYELLDEYNFIGNIATKGDIVYPVGSDGLPHATWWLHVHEIPYRHDEYDVADFWEHQSTNTEFCKACTTPLPDSPKEELRRFTCSRFCPKNNFFDSAHWFREDIEQKLLQDPFSVWFALRGANVALSGQEAKRLQEIVDELGYTKHPVGMPMDLLPFDEMEHDPIFQQGRIFNELKELAKVKTPDGRPPKIAVFQHRPYVYRNGHIQGDLFGPNTPILRIGDSLATGDPNRSSGFVQHVAMVRNLVCRIRGVGKECYKRDS